MVIGRNWLLSALQAAGLLVVRPNKYSYIHRNKCIFVNLSDRHTFIYLNDRQGYISVYIDVNEYYLGRASRKAAKIFKRARSCSEQGWFIKVSQIKQSTETPNTQAQEERVYM